MTDKKNLAQQLVTAIDTAINSNPKPPLDSRLLLGKSIFEAYPDAQINETERKLIKRLDAEWQTAWNTANIEFTEASARKAYNKQTIEHGEHARKGKLHTVETLSLDAITKEYLAKQHAAKEVLKTISTEASATIQEVTKRFLDFATLWLASREAAERKECNEFGLTWQPSPIVTAGRGLIATLKHTLESNAGNYGRPGDMIRFINLN